MAMCLSIECCFPLAVFPEDGCCYPKCIGDGRIYMITNRCAVGWKWICFYLYIALLNKYLLWKVICHLITSIHSSMDIDSYLIPPGKVLEWYHNQGWAKGRTICWRSWRMSWDVSETTFAFTLIICHVCKSDRTEHSWYRYSFFKWSCTSVKTWIILCDCR
jgi:hypothetical protein